MLRPAQDPAATVSAPGPAIAPDEALRRLADEPCLLFLDGAGSGWSYLAYDLPTLPLRTLDDLPAAGGAYGDDGHAGWPGPIDGGHLVQLDYDFPVGRWALPLIGDELPRGRCWPLRAWIAWDPAGGCTLHGQDASALRRLRQDLAQRALRCSAPGVESAPAPAWNRDAHRARVQEIREWIRAGDIYQANLTMPFTARLRPGQRRDLGIFLALRAAAPGCYGAFLRHQGRSILSHSPECFLRSDGTRCVSEPIKGTRVRVAGTEAAARADLIAAAKDNAELTMIVDLVRNDLGRVAARGGVRVAGAAQIMDLPYVHHLYARIEARLPPSRTVADLLRASFPAGSITGTPKIRAMDIIRVLEATRRGPYCGAIGWIGAGSACALSVAIRTLVIERDEVRVHAGGGIVADSDPDAEWEELHAKARPMLDALGEPPA